MMIMMCLVVLVTVMMIPLAVPLVIPLTMVLATVAAVASPCRHLHIRRSIVILKMQRDPFMFKFEFISRISVA